MRAAMHAPHAQRQLRLLFPPLFAISFPFVQYASPENDSMSTPALKSRGGYEKYNFIGLLGRYRVSGRNETDHLEFQ